MLAGLADAGKMEGEELSQAKQFRKGRSLWRTLVPQISFLLSISMSMSLKQSFVSLFSRADDVAQTRGS